MTHPLILRYPEGLVTITTFGNDHPDLMPTRRARHMIDTIAIQPEPVQRVFRKRFGRWFVHIPSLVDYLELESALVSKAPISV